MRAKLQLQLENICGRIIRLLAMWSYEQKDYIISLKLLKPHSVFLAWGSDFGRTTLSSYSFFLSTICTITNIPFISLNIYCTILNLFIFIEYLG